MKTKTTSEMVERAQEALRESEARYRHLFEQAPFGIGIATLNGNILETNKRMELITFGGK